MRLQEKPPGQSVLATLQAHPMSDPGYFVLEIFDSAVGFKLPCVCTVGYRWQPLYPRTTDSDNQMNYLVEWLLRTNSFPEELEASGLLCE